MRKFAQGSATLLAGLLALSSPAMAGTGALLDVSIAYPVINFQQGGMSQGAVYNGTQLIITATAPNMQFTPMGAIEVIGSGAVALTANINTSGVLSGGTFTISGTTVDTAGPTAYGSPLLTGTVLDYGIVDIASTDFVDFKLKVTGGSLASRVGGINATIGMSAALEGSTLAANYFGSNWAADNAKGQVGPGPGTIPFPCYNVSNLSVKNRSGTTNDEVHVGKGGVRLPTGASFNPATDNVQVTFDGLVINIPAGSFVNTGGQNYKFNTASGVTPKISMRINLDNNTWEFDLTKGNVALITTGDGVDVTLQIGVYTGTVHVITSSGGNSSSSSHSTHAPSCKLSGNSSDSSSPGYGKSSTIGALTLKTPNNAYVRKSRANQTISHPSTVYVDSNTGELAIVNTSGGVCLQCGQVVTGTNGGSFTIMEIRGRPGNKLAVKCGVYNASCNILPPGMSGSDD